MTATVASPDGLPSISIARYRRLTDTAARMRDVSWEQLTDALGRFDERSSKDGPLWSPVGFKAGHPTQRANTHVVSISAFVFDYDHAEPSWSLLDGLAYVAHTTFTHCADDPKCGRPDCPHWRVVVRLAEPIAADDYPKAWERLAFWLAPDADPSCKDLSRANYLPACRPGAAREIRRGEGAPIDWTTLRPVPPPLPVETAPPIRAATRPGTPNDGDRPGDRFNRETSWADILEPLGARCVSRLADGTERWQRPGKQDGISATADGAGSRVLYVFSSSWAPFEPHTSYTRFRAYALLEHGGDERAATRALAERYGMERPPTDGIVWAVRDGDTWTGEPEPVVAAPADAEDLAAQLAAARARIAELEAQVSPGSDGADTCGGNCPTSRALREQIAEYKAADRLVRDGPFSLGTAALVRYLIDQTVVARANGRERVPLWRPDAAAAINTNEKTITRAWAEIEALQADPEIKATMPFLLERRTDERGKDHVDLVIPFAAEKPSRRQMLIATTRLPRLKARPGGLHERKLPPNNPECRGCGEPMTTHRNRQDVCENDACGKVVTYPTQIIRPRREQAVLIHGDLYATIARADETETRDNLSPIDPVGHRGQVVPGLPRTLIPATFVSREDQEAAAKPHLHLVGDDPPRPPGRQQPWRCSCGSLERYAIQDGYRCDGCGRATPPLAAIAGGET